MTRDDGGLVLPAAELHNRIREAAFALLLTRRRPVSADELGTLTATSATALNDTLDELAAAGWVDRDGEGRVTGSAGLSLTTGPHRLEIDGAAFRTWCAYDSGSPPRWGPMPGSRPSARSAAGPCGSQLMPVSRRPNGRSGCGWRPVAPRCAGTSATRPSCSAHRTTRPFGPSGSRAADGPSNWSRRRRSDRPAGHRVRRCSDRPAGHRVRRSPRRCGSGHQRGQSRDISDVHGRARATAGRWRWRPVRPGPAGATRPQRQQELLASGLVVRTYWRDAHGRAVHAGFVGKDHGLHPVAKVELHQHPLHVGSDRRFLDNQRGGDLAVG
jgi:hypothetical protein